eukprot:TRINITY_DN5811_c0_g1_i1.p1 TRINITY_DN5811_c0_g1~~TRINITY_DN5811_c0_g1_i1.p1  ORF type:complete len:112 (-),score=37.20 TRINITY_DN5811_c0_g1_i1:122-415(-)
MAREMRLHGHTLGEWAALGEAGGDGLLHRHVKLSPQCAFNSYAGWRHKPDGVYQPGDFLVHFAGGSAPEHKWRDVEQFLARLPPHHPALRSLDMPVP